MYKGILIGENPRLKKNNVKFRLNMMRMVRYLEIRSDFREHARWDVYSGTSLPPCTEWLHKTRCRDTVCGCSK